MTQLPKGFKMYPVYLRELGYYCTNNSKEDYNLVKDGEVWNEGGRKATWTNRPDKDQPFFAIHNFTVSHESQIRKRPHEQIHNPAKVRVPSYHPDTPEVRQDWAQYYDKITEMDKMVGEKLKLLEEQGLAEDTIIFYYGDHGSGMPRSKRWPYFSGINVPLIIHVPEKWKHLAASDYKTGGKSDRRVGFIDLAPTLLSIGRKKPPAHMQGHALWENTRQPSKNTDMDLEEEWTSDMIWCAQLSERDISISETTCLISHMVSMFHICSRLRPLRFGKECLMKEN